MRCGDGCFALTLRICGRGGFSIFPTQRWQPLPPSLQQLRRTSPCARSLRAWRMRWGSARRGAGAAGPGKPSAGGDAVGADPAQRGDSAGDAGGIGFRRGRGVRGAPCGTYWSCPMFCHRCGSWRWDGWLCWGERPLRDAPGWPSYPGNLRRNHADPAQHVEALFTPAAAGNAKLWPEQADRSNPLPACWRRMTPEQRGQAAGTQAYTWIKAMEALYLHRARVRRSVWAG